MRVLPVVTVDALQTLDNLTVILRTTIQQTILKSGWYSTRYSTTSSVTSSYGSSSSRVVPSSAAVPTLLVSSTKK